jgi:hypothetical protein
MAKKEKEKKKKNINCYGIYKTAAYRVFREHVLVMSRCTYRDRCYSEGPP